MNTASIVKVLRKRRVNISITNSSKYGAKPDAKNDEIKNFLNFDVPYRFCTDQGDINPYITFDCGTHKGCVEGYAIRTVYNDHYPMKWQVRWKEFYNS